jgi:cholesterol transport system auxiliary component
LTYSDAQQLRPYAQARWSMRPAELLRLRLREQLGQSRTVLSPSDGLQASGPVLILRVDLDEFSQLFDASDRSVGLLRVRATLTQTGGSSGTEKLLAQRSFVLQRPSPSQDAAGGVRALTAAADAVGEELDQWIQQAR